MLTLRKLTIIIVINCFVIIYEMFSTHTCLTVQVFWLSIYYTTIYCKFFSTHTVKQRYIIQNTLIAVIQALSPKIGESIDFDWVKKLRTTVLPPFLDGLKKWSMLKMNVHKLLLIVRVENFFYQFLCLVIE